jgi:4'-phosphopantetheinyl transferase
MPSVPTRGKHAPPEQPSTGPRAPQPPDPCSAGPAERKPQPGAPDPWSAGPAEPQLKPGELHLWRASLDHVDDGLIRLLCEEESRRAARMLGARDRMLWTRSRGVLRALLGSYLERDPGTLSFTHGPHGKPALADGPISFNLSHSAGVALYALHATRAVGVDVQVARPSIDHVALARRFLPPPEAHRLARLGPDARPREFLRAWVRHEASVKCRGIGIRAATAGESHRSSGALSLTDLDVGFDAIGAVACDGPVLEMRCWRWPPAGLATG